MTMARLIFRALLQQCTAWTPTLLLGQSRTLHNGQNLLQIPQFGSGNPVLVYGSFLAFVILWCRR